MLYDLAMVGVLVYCAARGSRRGMAWQLAGIASLVLGLFFAAPLSAALAPSIHLEPPLNRWVAMLALYLGFSLACFGVARVYRGWLEAARLEEFDRHLGAGFGLLKGAVICFMVTLFAVCLSNSAARFILPTASGRTSAFVMEQLERVLPSDVDRVIHPYASRLEQGDLTQRSDDSPAPTINPRGSDATDGDRFPKGFRGNRRPDTSDSGSPSSPDPGAQPSGAAQPGRLNQWLDELPGAVQGEIEGRLQGAIDRTLNPVTPRAEPSANVDPTRSDPEPQPRGPSAPLATGRTPDIVSAANDIVAVFSSDERERATIERRLLDALDGLPPDVVAAALADWRSDLTGQGTDPDPGTDVSTPPVERISRQAERAGYAASQLPDGWRERLERALPQ